MIRGVLFDLDGVLYNGEEAIEGAGAAVAAVRAAGVPSLFVTNTTSRPRSALVEELRRFGVDAGPADFLTSPIPSAGWIRGCGDGLAAHFVPDATRQEFLGLDADPESPDLRCVVTGDLGAAWDYGTLNRAFRLLQASPDRELVALGLTRYWRSPDGLNLVAAPFVAALKCANGRRATVLGKPVTEFFWQAAAKLGLRRRDLLMIGDHIRADVMGAKSAGLQAALVRTGKFSRGDLDLEGERPDWVLDSVRDLPGLLAHCGD